MEIFLNSIVENVNLIAMTLGSLKMEAVCVSYGFYKIQGFSVNCPNLKDGLELGLGNLPVSLVYQYEQLPVQLFS